MAEKTTWIKIDRNILEWGWYKDANTKSLFIHLLLKANIKKGNFMGVEIKRGELATSYVSLAEETGLSVKNVRTALEHLKTTGEVAVKRHRKFSVISIPNYTMYQDIPAVKTAVNRQLTGSQTAVKRQQSKNVRKKEEKNIYTRAREGERDSDISDIADVAETDRSWEDELNVPNSLRGEFGCEEDYLAFYERQT